MPDFLALILSVRMTRQAGAAVILIPVYLFVFFVRFSCGMTCDASKYGIVVWVGMALAALVPFILVLSTVNREVHIIMIPGGWHPRILIMTQRTICWKLSRLMIRIIGLIILCEMASAASVWCVVVISVMAQGALITYCRMCSQ
jgi:hypothetical protein